MKKISLLIPVLSFIVLSCNKDKDEVTTPPPADNESEVLTTLELHFTEIGNPLNTFTYRFSDPDGIGGNPPSADLILLSSSTDYIVSIDVLNETVSPADTLTGEIYDERDEHFFCFEPTIPGFSVIRTDSDNNGYEIGLLSQWTCGSAGTGTLTISLKHQPGIKNGTCSPGETDLEAQFNVTVN